MNFFLALLLLGYSIFTIFMFIDFVMMDQGHFPRLSKGWWLFWWLFISWLATPFYYFTVYRVVDNVERQKNKRMLDTSQNELSK